MREAQDGKWFGGERVVIDPEWEGVGSEEKSGYAINGDLIEVFLEEEGVEVLKGMLRRREVSAKEEEGEYGKWNGNEIEERQRRFGELLEKILGEDLAYEDLDERVEKCVEWVGGIMVEML